MFELQLYELYQLNKLYELKRMGYELFISMRYLLAKRKEKFISLISLISILGVAVGVMALIVVLSVMGGFRHDLREKIIGTNAHIIIEREGGMENSPAIIDRVLGLDYVVAASPFIVGETMIRYQDRVKGVLFKGIDPEREVKVTKLSEYIVKGDLDFKEEGVILGKELAQSLGAYPGDRVSLVSPTTSKVHHFIVEGIFNSGMYEYDMNLVFGRLSSAQRLFNVEGLVSSIGLKLDNVYQAERVKRQIQEMLGFPYWVRSWMDINRSLFSALRLEKTVMFIILSLIVIVACFNIVSTLIMVVMDKTKDIGILKSIGATNKSIKKIFASCGFIIGLMGTALGAGVGFLLCYLLKTYRLIKLPADIYYIDRLPVRVEWTDSLIIILAAIMISWVATLYPARQAARLSPVEALRYE